MSTSEAMSGIQKRADGPCAQLEDQLMDAVADFGTEELSQMLDAADAIRRLRRV